MMNKKFIFLLLLFFSFSFLGWSFIQKDKSIQSQMENNDKIHEEKYKIKTGNDMTIYTATDIHYLAKDLTDDGEAYKKYVASGDGKQLQYIDEIINAFTYEIENKKPDILIISGDLTNNGEKESHIELSKK